MRDIQEHMVYLEIMFSDYWKISKYIWYPFEQLKGNNIDG